MSNTDPSSIARLGIERTKSPIGAELVPHTSEAETAFGVMTYLSQDDPIGRSLREYGEWAGTEIEFLLSLVREGDVVLDVGANIGTHSLAFAARVGGTGSVLSFETHPLMAALLAHNACANGRENLVVLECYVGDEPTRVVRNAPLDPAAHGNFGAHAPSAHAGSGAAAEGDPAVVVTIDSLGLERVDLIKIDAEGSEGSVLRGARSLLREAQPLVYFEANTADAAWPAISTLRDASYVFFFHRASAFRETNHRANPRNTFRFAEESNVLAVPPTRLSALESRLHAEGLIRFESIDSLARLVFETPRYWDESAYDRDAARLRTTLSETTARLAAAREDVAALERALLDAEARGRAWAQALKDANEAQARSARDAETLRAVHERDAEHIRRLEQRERGGRLLASAYAGSSLAAPLRPLIRAEVALRRLASGGSAAAPLSLSKSIEKGLARVRRREREARYLRAHPLFDASFYAQQSLEVRSLRVDAATHYVSVGAAEGLDPSPYFHTRFYLERNGDVASTTANPFVHYLQHGGYEGRSPNPYFDGAYYLRSHPEIQRGGEHPLAHYIRTVKTATARPSPAFDPGYYLERYEDVGAAGLEPLAHYLLHGFAEGRVPRDTLEVAGVAVPRWSTPTSSEWASCPSAPAPDAGHTTVVVVARPDEPEVLRTIHSILSTPAGTSFDLLVLCVRGGDGRVADVLWSLAERRVLNQLESLDAREVARRVRQLRARRDVLLVAKPIEVHANWIVRLDAASRVRGEAATVSPLTDGRYLGDRYVTLEGEDLGCARVNVLLGVDGARSPVAALRPDDAVVLFPRGERAPGNHLLAADVLVRRLSLGRPDGVVAEVLGETLSAEVGGAGVEAVRAAIDLARVRAILGDTPMAIVTHTRGGGTEQHAQEIAAIARAAAVGVVWLRPTPDDERSVMVSVEGAPRDVRFARVDLHDGVDTLASLLENLGVRHLHVHHLCGFEAEAPRWVEALLDRSAFVFDYTVHDYSPVCPRVFLIDESGRYCGEPDEARCNACVRENGSEYGLVEIGGFRRNYAALLARARYVFVPDEDVARRLLRYFPQLTTTVRPHPEPHDEPQGPRAFAPGDELVVGVIGAIGPHKGFEVVCAAAERVRRLGLPIRFVVIGYTCDDARARDAGIEITGPYATREQAYALLAEHGVHVGFFPSVWPETYSYALSVALHAGLVPASFDLGAIARRLRELDSGILIPCEGMADPRIVVDAFEHAARNGLPNAPTYGPRTYTYAEYYAASEPS